MRHVFTTALTSLALAIGACAGPTLSTPTRNSPVSPHADEAPVAPVATSLTEDPLAQEPSSSGADAHASHSGHGQTANAPPDAGRPSTEYVCPMHPDVHQAGPGRCPQCGMNLVPTPSEHHQHQHGTEHAH